MNSSINYELLKTLCSIHAPSGKEDAMKQFILNYIEQNKSGWQSQPEIFHGDDFQNCIVLVFGQPRTAVFAHMDSIGYTARYGNEVVRIGAPHSENGYKLVGADSQGNIECSLKKNADGDLKVTFNREIERGTELTFQPNWREDAAFVQCCYMDNRLGVLNALNLCSSVTDGAIVFSCWEEHGGGSVPYLIRFLYERYKIKMALISDITWVTEGVTPSKGVVISLRDTGIPRKSFVQKIIAAAQQSVIPFQLEVEGSGGSDGTEIQKQPYPIDWCFIGAPEDHVHTPDEKVHKKDIESMFQMYVHLMKTL